MKNYNQILTLQELKKITQNEIKSNIIKNNNVWSFGLNIDGEIYSAMFCGEDIEFNLWNKTGNILLYNSNLNIDVDEMLLRVNNFKNDLVKCSGSCEKFIPYKKSHQYFAGYYCDECFTTNIKENRDWGYSHLD